MKRIHLAIALCVPFCLIGCGKPDPQLVTVVGVYANEQAEHSMNIYPYTVVRDKEGVLWITNRDLRLPVGTEFTADLSSVTWSRK